MVCLLMALMFAVNPLLYLKDEGKLPIPFAKRLGLKPAAASPCFRSAAAVAAVARCQRSRRPSRRTVDGREHETKTTAVV